MILVSKEPFVGVDYMRLFTAMLRGKANKRSEEKVDPIMGASHHEFTRREGRGENPSQ